MELVGAENKVVNTKWTPEEDARLAQAHAKIGPQWCQIAHLLGGNRLGKQVRERWLNHVSPDIRRSDWSSDEDLLLLSLIESHGKDWKKIGTIIPGRNNALVKNRYYAFLAKREESLKLELPIDTEKVIGRLAEELK